MTRTHNGVSVREIDENVTRIVARERGVETMTARCGLCDWTFDGETGAARLAQFEHRQEHARAARKRPDETTSRSGGTTAAQRREALASMEERQQTDPKPEPPRPTAAKPIGRPKRWTRDAILEAFARWHSEHGSRPTSHDWRGPAGSGYPDIKAVIREFGSWSAALEVAGFERTTRPPGASEMWARLDERLGRLERLLGLVADHLGIEREAA